MGKNDPRPIPKPVENDPHKRSGVAHGQQTTTMPDGSKVCNICGGKA